MPSFILSAFADEAADSLEGQIAAMEKNGVTRLELRGVGGKNVTELTAAEAKEIKKQLDAHGIRVWALGSPIGKISLTDDFAAHLETLRHTLKLGEILEAENLRLFSFFIPADKKPEECREQVFDWMGRMLETAAGSPMALCHENEKAIYGDTAPRCLDLLQHFPQLHAVFDPANFIQCHQATRPAFELLRPRICYMHIKDAKEDGSVVPAGKGAGELSYLLSQYAALGGRELTQEPHLTVFTGLAGLEQAGARSAVGAYAYPSREEAFDAACVALRELTEKGEE